MLSKGGKGPWTLPAICPPPVDKAGGSSDGGCPALNDSFAIALALDSRFPSTESSRQLFPDRASLAFARVVQGLFNAGITQKGCAPLPCWLHDPWADTLRPLTFHIRLILWIRFIPSYLLDDRGAAYFTRTREESFGMPLNQVGTPDDRAKDLQSLIEALKPITQALAAHEQDGLEGSSSSPYLMGGDQPTYADMIVLGFLAWAHRAELAAGDAVEPKGGWFTPLLEADGGELGRLWEAGRELVEGQGLGVVEWKA